MGDIIKYREIVDRMDSSAIVFEHDIELMKFEKLRTKTYNRINSDFVVIVLDIDAVLDALDYPALAVDLRAQELMIDKHMKDLIDFAGTGAKFIPPVIYEIGDRLTIYDGKHRIALCRYLKYKQIPFLVRKNSVTQILTIVHR